MHAERTPEQVAWAAGLFEGEGWWGPRGRTSAEAVVGMTDRDVVERFAEIVGFGTITTEDRSARGHKACYRWSATSATRVKALIEMFWPWLGARRRADAEAILQAIEACPGPNGAKTHCPSGHPYNETNTYLYKGDRRCRQCHRDRVNAAARARRERVVAA